MTTKEKIEVMQAFEDGKQIQIADKFYNNWNDVAFPSWNWVGFNYRIKPEEKKRIPAIKEELEIIENGPKWCRNKKNPNKMGWIRHNDKLNRAEWYLFNPETKCWEDWSEQ